MPDLFLPDIPEARVRAAFARSPGNEIASGKFAHPDSSAPLAANGFGWFLDSPDQLPPFPPLIELEWPATLVNLEREMRFPWSGGRHPWLDAAPPDRGQIQTLRAVPRCQARAPLRCL